MLENLFDSLKVDEKKAVKYIYRKEEVYNRFIYNKCFGFNTYRG
jgi:hypothetical protein